MKTTGYPTYSYTAILCVRFGMKGILDHTLGSNLMSSHMATGYYFGPDRVRMMVRYAPEPILGEAACQLLHFSMSGENTTPHFDAEELSVLLVANSSLWLNGLVDFGDLGELVGRIILSMAYDFIKLKDVEDGNFVFFSTPIRVADFLAVIAPNSLNQEFRSLFSFDLFKIDDQELLNGRIILTGYSYLHNLPPGEMSQDLLRQAYEYGVGLIMPNCFPGTDLVIPVHLGGGRFTFITCQIKFRDYISFDERILTAGSKLTPNYCFSTRSSKTETPFSYEHPFPYIALHIDPRAKSITDIFGKLSAENTETLQDFTTSYPAHIILPGLDHYEFLSSAPLRKAINTFFPNEVDVINVRRRKKELKIMDPVAFRSDYKG